MKTFTRNLMIAANDYQAVHGKAPEIRIAYVSSEFYGAICANCENRGDTFNGYKIMVVLNNDHPDYLIYLR